MSHTISRPGRFSRLAAGLTVAAAATAITLLSAAPAHAQPNSVSISTGGGSTMSISGTLFRDVLTATGGGSTVTLKDDSGIAITAIGPNCQSFGATAQCTGVSTISFTGDAGNDVFNNETSRRSTLNGGSGTDVLLGGSGDDSLFGSVGTADRVFGGAGSDLCIAEFEKDCER